MYPHEARHAGKTGELLVGFIVLPDGSVDNAYIVRSSDPIFDEAALAAVRSWNFIAGRRQGKPVPMRMQVPVVFALNG